MARQGYVKGSKSAADERQQKAFDLRVAGASYRSIGRQLGVSEAQAHRDIHLVTRRIVQATNEVAEEYIAVEMERLDRALLAVATKMQAGSIEAVNAWVRICESRRRLLGLDAPVRLEWLNGLSDDMLGHYAGMGAGDPEEAKIRELNSVAE